jgi:hypothetical protein
VKLLTAEPTLYRINTFSKKKKQKTTKKKKTAVVLKTRDG